MMRYLRMIVWAFRCLVSGSGNVAMGAAMSGAVPLDVAVQEAFSALVFLVAFTWLVGGVPRVGDGVAEGSLEVDVPILKSFEAVGVIFEIIKFGESFALAFKVRDKCSWSIRCLW